MGRDFIPKREIKIIGGLKASQRYICAAQQGRAHIFVRPLGLTFLFNLHFQNGISTHFLPRHLSACPSAVQAQPDYVGVRELIREQEKRDRKVQYCGLKKQWECTLMHHWTYQCTLKHEVCRFTTNTQGLQLITLCGNISFI